MPSKKKKYNARFPAGRIKKIMQSDEEIGKVAQAVPVIISRTLELFVESLLNKTLKITNSRNAKTLSTSHMKQCIMSEQRFDFLRELVKNIPDISVAEEAAASYNEQYNSGYNEEELQQQSSPEDIYPDSDTPYDLSMPSTSTQATHRAAAASATNGDYTRQHTTTPATHKYADNGGAANLSIPRAFIDEQSRAHLKRDTEIKQRLRQRITSSAAAAAAAAAAIIAKPSSVIMHTTSLVNAQTEDCLPPKLLRTDSAPATAAINWHQHQSHHQSPQQSHLQRQQRLKHQSHSVPNASNSCPPTRTPTNQQQMQEQQQHTLPPIPAPIVSIDFCNKPVVKIDYSNLSLPATLPLAPHSAPVTNKSNASGSGFNFNAEPIINIDLSNIVGTSSAAGATAGAAIAVGAASAASIHKHPAAVATISIGNIAAAKTLVAVPTNATINNNSSSSSDKAAPNTSAPKKDSFFELDEDYDNI